MVIFKNTSLCSVLPSRPALIISSIMMAEKNTITSDIPYIIT